MTEPEQIDKDIDISSSTDFGKKKNNSSRRKYPAIVWVLSIFAVVLIAILIFPADNSGSFNTSISSEEQDLRNLMSSIAGDIHEYSDLNGKLPMIPGDMEIPSQNIVYTAEDDSSWLLISGDSLIYYSDMDPLEFAEGDI